MTDYPDLAKKVLECSTVFPSIYLCETAFSLLTYLNSKLRNKLDVESDLILKLSDIKPNITAVSYTHLDVYKRQNCNSLRRDVEIIN